mmetsp:Transcript_41430/g.111261  ORF Transcript_41430/g.111261 Transcript_41430/m.111261 type:complete len:281 (-) Transcript_41430:190-1032(-)
MRHAVHSADLPARPAQRAEAAKQALTGRAIAARCAVSETAASAIQPSSLPHSSTVATGCAQAPPTAAAPSGASSLADLHCCMCTRKAPPSTTTSVSKAATTRSSRLGAVDALASASSSRSRAPLRWSCAPSSASTSAPVRGGSSHGTSAPATPSSSCGFLATALVPSPPGTPDKRAPACPCAASCSSAYWPHAARTTMHVMATSSAESSSTMAASCVWKFSSTPRKVPQRAAGTTRRQAFKSMTRLLDSSPHGSFAPRFTSSEDTAPKKTIAFETGTASR